jgi:hypothetical protein
VSEPRTLDEWRRASELADAELESFDRRAAARPMTAWEAKARAAGFTLAVEAGRRRDREALVNAAEDARLGLLAATHAAEEAAEAHAQEPDPPPRSGPEVIATRAEVEAMRDALAAKGQPHGYDSIAKAGGWSVATVRRRLTGH